MVLRVTRLIRIFKLTKHSVGLQVIESVCSDSPYPITSSLPLFLKIAWL